MGQLKENEDKTKNFLKLKTIDLYILSKWIIQKMNYIPTAIQNTHTQTLKEIMKENASEEVELELKLCGSIWKIKQPNDLKFRWAQ